MIVDMPSADLKKVFIINWLEDINWHKEVTLLLETGFNDKETIYDLEAGKDLGSLNYYYNRADKEYLALSRIFGWGINHEGWTSSGMGQEFVDELLELINEEE